MALRPKILVTAPSNAAVDAILMRIVQKGFIDGTLRRRVLRVSIFFAPIHLVVCVSLCAVESSCVLVCVIVCLVVTVSMTCEEQRTCVCSLCTVVYLSFHPMSQ